MASIVYGKSIELQWCSAGKHENIRQSLFFLFGIREKEKWLGLLMLTLWTRNAAVNRVLAIEFDGAYNTTLNVISYRTK